MPPDQSDDHSSEYELLIPPREAATRLGVSPSGLRRLATLWEQIYGPIRWEGEREGGGRVYPETVIAKLEAARALVQQGQSKSIQNALQALDSGTTPSLQGLARPGVPQDDILLALLNEIRSMREELTQLRVENLEMKNQLPPPEASDTLASELRALQERVSALTSIKEPTMPNDAQHPGEHEVGVLVRAAARLERLWRAVRGRQ